MSSTVITLLVVLAFASGLGLGLVLIMRQPKVTKYKTPPGEIYFGRSDDDDHPHDIERAAAHRYDGVTKDEYGNSYLSSGLDFGRYPR